MKQEISKKFADLGFDAYFAQKTEQYGGLIPARVSRQHREIYNIIAESGEYGARVSGKFSYRTVENAEYPAVGDWVMAEIKQGSNEALIHYVLPRKSAFERGAAGRSKQRQIVAANIDVVFICMSLARDFNLRRLERYLTVAFSSGALPAVVLTKTDLCEDINYYKNEVEKIAPATDILLCNAVEEDGCAGILSYLQAGKTYAFIGSSGTGKSTLINRIAGENLLETGGLRGDGKGRHTTTHRELILLPNGCVVIDTPGMRELQVDSGDTAQSFADIEELALHCRFSDCTHTAEPGCAVTGAVRNGSLSEKRLENYFKLQKEAAYRDANWRLREQMKIEAMFGGKKQMKRIMDEAKKRRR